MSFKDKLHPLIRRKRNNKYNDTNYAVINAFDTVLDEMETETLESKAQSAIHTATGWFLDNGWGSWFGVKRHEGETDEKFRERIIYKVQIPRGTVEAVKYGIREYLDNEYVGIKIYEPWEDIFYLNDSKLNSDAHLIGEYYNYGVMDVTIGSSFPKDMLKVIDLFKPAGVTVHVRVDTNLPSIDPNAKPGLLATQTLNASEYNATYSQVIGMDEGINGVFSVHDKLDDIYGSEFITNKSLVNDNNALLANTFKKLDGLAHNVSLGSDFRPTRKFTMDEALSKTDTLVSKDSVFTVQDNNKGYIYFTVDTSILYDVHSNYSLGRTRESFINYLADHNIILNSMGTKGQGYSIEYFNFLNREWEIVSDGIYDGVAGKINSFKLEMGKALNDNLLITVRLKTNNKPLTVNDFYMEYRYKGTLTESAVKYTSYFEHSEVS